MASALLFALPCGAVDERLQARTESWRQDLRFFATQLREHHRNPFHLVTEQQFEAAVTALDTKIPQLQDYGVVVGLESLAALVGDGHTFVVTSGSQHRFPLKLYWFANELRVVAASRDYARAVGTRVGRIDGMKIADVMRRIQQVVPQGETQWYVLNQSAEKITRAEVLASLGAISNVSHCIFTFEGGGSGEFTLDIASVAADEKIDWTSPTDRLPLYRQHERESFWFTEIAGSHTVYVGFRKYDELEQHARELFAFLDRRMPKCLIVDMRDNGGGNYAHGREYLLYGIQARRSLNRRGSLYVITGRGTFSAGMTNAIDFRRETEALLVGEPPGARPNGYQENYWFTLPRSQLRVSVATNYYRFSDTDSPVVEPDQRFDPSWADYKAGRDAATAWVLQRKECL
ncbi:MAG TPA: hypothetical protein VH814_14115 [Steroidobacteraceae bacterium]